ncbi:MAG: NIF family HAD-type phosphatase [Nannocystales bacterium]
MTRYDKLLVLDLDETLVHACERPLGREPDFCVGPYALYRRPHLDTFLAGVFTAFEHVGIWTASTLPYAIPVLEQIVDRRRLSFVWGRERCTYQYVRDSDEHVMLKPIRKLRRAGFRKEHILYVDDSPEKLTRSYSNLVPIRPYVGDLADAELPHVLTYLHTLGPLENVRPIEKRWWRTRLERERE